MASVIEIITFSDVVAHLEDFVQAGATGADARDLKRAVQSAYKNLAQLTNWSYYDTEHDVPLVANYTTGTITYTESTRTVDFAGSGFAMPTWAADGRIKISDAFYPIYSQPTSTSVVLFPGITPNGDVAAGTTYELVRSLYELPSDMQNMDPPQSTSWPAISSNNPASNLSIERLAKSTASDPHWYTLIGDPRRYGRMAIDVKWTPNAANGIRFFYRRIPRPLKFSGEESNSITGTVAITAGTDDITGSGTTFTSDMVGEVIRLPATGDTTVPTGLGGLNPYVEQRIIKTFTNATTIVLDANAANTISGSAFEVSSPVDIRPTMMEALLRGAEYYLMRARASRDKPVEYYRRTYHEEVRVAMEQEAMIDGVANHYRPKGIEVKLLTPSLGYGIEV